MTADECEQVLREIEAKAPENDWPIIGPERGAFLVELVRQHQPRRVLEVGALVGYSSTLIARNLPEGGRVVSVEIDSARAELTRQTQRRCGVAERCEVVVGPAGEVIAGLSGPWDLVFIDAAKDEYLDYLRAAEPQLAPQAVIVADNVKRHAQTLAGYLDYVRDAGRYQSRYHDFGWDGVEVSIRAQAAG